MKASKIKKYIDICQTHEIDTKKIFPRDFETLDIFIDFLNAVGIYDDVYLTPEARKRIEELFKR